MLQAIIFQDTYLFSLLTFRIFDLCHYRALFLYQFVPTSRSAVKTLDAT